MKKLIIIFLLSTLLTNLTALAKGKEKDQFEKYMKEGNDDLYDRLGEYEEALASFIKAYNIYPNDAEVNFKIGLCHLNSINRSEALPYLQKAHEINPEFHPQLHLLMAEAYHLNYDFDKAITLYQYQLDNPAPEEDGELEVTVPVANVIYCKNVLTTNKMVEIENIDDIMRKRIEECNNGKEMYQNPKNITLKNLGTNVNGQYPDYAPVLTTDAMTMYFTSRRPRVDGSGQVDIRDDQIFEDIYVTYNINGDWSKAVAVTSLNGPSHESALALSNDGSILYIYGDDGNDLGDISYAKFEDGEWERERELDEVISGNEYERTITFSPDGKVAYFVRDNDDNNTGRDIFMSRKDEKGKWGKVERISNDINTKYDEDGVFFHPDGRTLYFSSTGHNSMGGYDIFRSVWRNGAWSKPVNMGYPINTPDNDIFFNLTADGKTAYMSSVRKEGLGDKDIYKVDLTGQSANETEVKYSQPLTLVTGKVKDANSKDPLRASLYIVDLDANRVIAEMVSNNVTGNYMMSLPAGKNYGIAVEKEGYLFHSENFEVPETNSYEAINKDILLQPVAVGSRIVLNNIFFDFDKATLRPESKAELDRVAKYLTKYPKMTIEISGHTDDKGTPKYNKKLSKQRAQTVIDYLADTHSIDKKRLTAAGYGETKPIANNDSDLGRQLNRRTEFEIVSLN